MIHATYKVVVLLQIQRALVSNSHIWRRPYIMIIIVLADTVDYVSKIREKPENVHPGLFRRTIRIPVRQCSWLANQIWMRTPQHGSS